MIYPLSQTQMGIYITCMNTQEEGSYNIDMLYSLDDDIDLNRLASALDKVVECHPCLKSRIVTDENGDIVFEDHTDDEYHTQIIEINDIEDVRSHLGEDYDLMHDPLFRFEIYKTPKGNYMYLDVHHVIFDGMSFGVVREDITRAYAGEELEPEKKNGFQVALDEIETRKTKVFEEAKEWYANEFGGATEVDSMPLGDVYGAEEQHYVTTYKKLSVDKEALNAMLAEVGVKESVLFTAAFGYTLAKYTGDDEALYTTVFHGRMEKALKRTVSMMVKTLPVYHNFTQTPTVADLLHQTASQTLGTRRRPSYSFGEQHTDLGIQSEINFVYQGAITNYDIILDGKKQASEDLRRHRPGLELNLQLITKDDEYFARIEYPTHRFTASFIDTFVVTYNKIISEMLIKQNLADIECVTEEQTALLDSFNHAIPDYEEATVLGCFKKAAATYPDNIAAVCNGKRYTYRELDELTDKVGAIIYNKVKDCGKQEPVVSILINRNEGMFIYPLAAIKAGCAYQPLDPSYPQDRLNFMVKDADAALVIADDNLKDILNEYEGEIILTSNIEQSIDSKDIPTTLPGEGQGGASLFILLYTSGSTGVPKGVMLEHRNIVAFNCYYAREFNITSESKIAGYASFGFDANMMDVFCSLMNGATFHVIDENIRLDLEALHNYFECEGISLCFMTTQVGVQYLENYPQSASLKNLVMGGEKLRAVKPETLSYNIYNGYGPSETTCGCAFFKVEHYEPNIPIGTPTDTVQLFVVDKNLHRLPWGAAGELIIAGKQVGRGYLNRPDKTAEAFFTWNSMRAYHSGDIVRYRENGNIEFVGRKDGQVKIRGFRIELKEVEAVIRDFEGIRDVTVQAFDDPNGGKFIAAYIVSESEVNIKALNDFIRDQKPPYMVPAVTMQIDAIPLNVNQKVDKKALPKPEFQQKAASDAPAAPLNKLEEEIKGIIAEIVKTDDFSITEPLAYIGLTSISSIRLATLIYKRFGVQINSKQLIKDGTLQSIENEILQQWMQGGIPAIESQKTAESGEAEADLNFMPLTYPQMGVYIDCLRNPGSTYYNIPSRISLPDNIGIEELKDAVVKTVDNHQSFRLVFTNMGGEPCQKLCPEMPVDIPVRELSYDDREEYEHEFARPFNLATGPLFRFEIVQSDGLYLYVDVHHLISDGGSIDILVKEITSRLSGEAVDAEEYSYMQFAHDQKEAEGGEEYTAAKSFFNERLACLESASEITADRKCGENDIHSLGDLRQPVNIAPVEDLAKKLGVTPMSIFLAATYYTVSRFVNSKQVFLGTISNGRSNLRTYNTMGMFVNTLALCSEIKDQTVTDYIKETTEMFAKTIQHEQYPFAQIAADFGLHPEIFFEYQVGVVAQYDVKGEPVSLRTLYLDRAKFKIKIAIYDSPRGGQDIVIGYDEAYYSPEIAATLAESLAAVVDHFIAQPDALVKNISIMSKKQKEQVAQFRNVATAPLENNLFFKPIEKFAETQPDRTALIATDQTLTYREFNAEANRIAHALMARGVKRGDRVVILLPRTSAVMLSIFGVSKSGAAYIPCDPEYPAERINLITEDSEAAYVITTQEHMEEHSDKAILVDELLNYEAEGCMENPDVELSGDDLVYLIYTSGSTGRPKGVMLRHEGICNYLQNHPGNRHIHAMVTEGHCYLSVTTLSFDMSLKEYGVALFNGLTLVLSDENQSNNPIELARLFRETGADIFNATPSRLLNYMELPEFCEALSQCKCILSGGEAYSDKLLARLHELNPAHIFNTYGPTEITVSSNCAELTHTDHITIGQPLLNYTEFVVDADGNELPAGVVGELYIGGIGVAKGYNNLETQTKERFVSYTPDASEMDAIRCYRSGDYARWTADGRVAVLGRMDNQIKLRGLRIELGEVEAAICKVEGVKQTVVMVKKIDGQDHLVAYYTAERPIEIDEMKTEISKTLTHYMVPTAYLQMSEFPLTPNGKTDVKHLPEPQLAKVGGDYVAPRGKAEEDFCKIFANILQMDKVSAADSFFELGGTSLTVTRVMIEAQNLGYEISYSDVFKYVTAQQLARLVSGDDASALNADTELTDYDYSKINELLSHNTLDSFRQGERLELGNVILTGANGYLGIHILHHLLEHHLKENEELKVYCLVRHGRNGVTSEARLRNLLFYYFEKSYKDIFGKQLFIIDGDVTNPAAFDELEKTISAEPGTYTLINCAAIVKHFSEGTEIEDINIGGLQNCVDFCLRTGSQLIQTSTNSTGGQSINGYPDPAINFSEQSHYFGQALTSKYTHSKFLAERIVLEAIIEKGLIAKVMRLGNLAPRSVDGEFQINFRSNSAMGRLHIFQMLGMASYAQTMSKMEFSPIDEVAHAILLLSTTPKECVVFHPFNDHMVKLGDVIMEMGHALGINIDEVEDEVFEDTLHEAAQDPEKAKILQSMLAYKAGGKDKVVGFAKYNPYTINVLARLGFHWNVTSWDYVQKFVAAIAGLDFFEDKR